MTATFLPGGKRLTGSKAPRTQPYPGSKGGRSSRDPKRNRISLAKVNLPPVEEDDDAG